MKILNHFIGTLGADPRGGTSADGKKWASFRLAVAHDGYNPNTGQYEEFDTTWFDVSAFGVLAANVNASLHKGDQVLVIGRLRMRDWSTEEKSGTTPQIIAEAIGPNIRFGVSNFQKMSRRRDAEEAQETDAQSGDEVALQADPVTGELTNSDNSAGAAQLVGAGQFADGGEPPF